MSTKKELADKCAAELSNMVNQFGLPAEEIANAMAHEHRTLQQSFMGLCIAFIEAMARHEIWDPRNERAVQFAKKVVAATDERDRYMPFV